MKGSLSVFIGIYFLLLFVFSFALSRFENQAVPGRIIYLFRAFFPSWKFFEDYGDVPILFYRLSASEKELGGWIPCGVRPKRRLYSLLVNPEGNFYLACTSLLQQVVSELEELEGSGVESFEKTVGYQLIHNLVRFQIAQPHALVQGSFYQFKVCSCLEDSSLPIREDVFISPVYPFGNLVRSEEL